MLRKAVLCSVVSDFVTPWTVATTILNSCFLRQGCCSVVPLPVVTGAVWLTFCLPACSTWQTLFWPPAHSLIPLLQRGDHLSHISLAFICTCWTCFLLECKLPEDRRLFREIFLSILCLMFKHNPIMVCWIDVKEDHSV